jgi:hypothetical protein
MVVMRIASVLVAVLVILWSHAPAAARVRVQAAPPVLQLDFLYADFGVDPSRAEREVVHVGEADFLVALHVARASGVDLAVVITWRRGGMSWDAITRHCKRDGRIYYVELPPEATGPPYGRAHGHWRRHPQSDIRLTDEEIRALVLVRAVAGHCKLPCGEVVRLRVRGESPKAIAARHRRTAEDAAPAAPAARRGEREHVPPGGRRK